MTGDRFREAVAINHGAGWGADGVGGRGGVVGWMGWGGWGGWGGGLKWSCRNLRLGEGCSWCACCSYPMPHLTRLWGEDVSVGAEHVDI